MMNRDEVREYLSRQGITVNGITKEQVLSLRRLLNKHLKASGVYRGTARLRRIGSNYKYLTMKTEEWENREAVSFNSDGFIGFAGWADNRNIRPILDAVVEWAEKQYPDDKDSG